jgi:hypothetical protein
MAGFNYVGVTRSHLPFGAVFMHDAQSTLLNDAHVPRLATVSPRHWFHTFDQRQPGSKVKRPAVAEGR